MLDNVLVLSPHQDDEVLGMGGTLCECDNLHIFYFNDQHPMVEQLTYDAEAAAVRYYLGCSTSYSKFMGVNRLPEVPIVEFISEIEELINKLRPTTIFIPTPSVNQDHRHVHAAALTACRIHDTNFTVRNVLLYEEPESHVPAFTQFVPHMFVPIDVQSKLRLYGMYKSQQRGHRTFAHVKALAEMRGFQAGVPYAEAFSAVRMVHG